MGPEDQAFTSTDLRVEFPFGRRLKALSKWYQDE